jgi:hypothetical protein
MTVSNWREDSDPEEITRGEDQDIIQAGKLIDQSRFPASVVMNAADNKAIASELHRWGRMTGVFAIILMVTWLVLDAVPSPDPTLGAVKSCFLWPGIVLTILAAIGLSGGFRLHYLAGHKR